MNTMDQIKKSTDVIQKLRPVYQPILGFYSQLFLARLESRQEIDLPPVEISPDILKMKIENQMPLVNPFDFLIDFPRARHLLERICDLAQTSAPELSHSAVKIKKGMDSGTLDLEKTAGALLTDGETIVAEQAGGVDVPVSELIFFIQSAITPSIETCAEQLASLLVDVPDHKKGYCPICGSSPDLAFFDEGGCRHLKCAFCSHQWRTQRMGCVFCEDNDKDRQLYFYSDAEKEYRVNLCDHCRQYIKLVDLRKMDRPFCPDVEMIASLHLDFKAREKGYAHPTHPQA